MDSFILVAQSSENAVVPRSLADKLLTQVQFAALQKCEAIIEYGHIHEILCMECTEHYSEVNADPDGVLYGICKMDFAGKFIIPKNAVQAVRFDLKALLQNAHDELGLRDRVLLLSNDIWKLGSLSTKDTTVDVYFIAKNNGTNDGTVLKQNQSSSASLAIIISLNGYTPPDAFIDRTQIILLSSLMTVQRKKINWNERALFAFVDTKKRGEIKYRNRKLYFGDDVVLSTGRSQRIHYFLSFINTNSDQLVSFDKIKSQYEKQFNTELADTASDYVKKVICSVKALCKNKKTKEIVDRIIEHSKDETGKLALIFHGNL